MKSSAPNISKASLLHEVRNELECPICREFFNEPKQLLCGHTFCNNCLLRVSGESHDQPFMGFTLSSFQCPQCRQSHHGRIQDIGTNYILKDMVEKLKGAHESDEEPEPCTKCTKLTSLTELFLCNTCPTNSAQLQPKYCSLCTIQQHNGHSLKPYQEIVVQKGLDNMQSKVHLLHQNFQNNKEKIETIIELSMQTLNSMKEEFNALTLPIHERFESHKPTNNIQHYTTEIKNNLDKEFTRNQLLNARMEKYATEIKKYLERFMGFDDYAKKFMRLDSPTFDNIELEQMAFDEEIQQHLSEERRFGLGLNHPYIYITASAARGRHGPNDRRPPPLQFNPNDLVSDSDNDDQVDTRPFSPYSADELGAMSQNNTQRMPTPTRLFDIVDQQHPSLIPSESRGSLFGSGAINRGRGNMTGGFGSRPIGNNRFRRHFSANSSNNGNGLAGNVVGGRGGVRGGFGVGRGRGGGLQQGNNNTTTGCHKCHATAGNLCRCTNWSRGGGRGGSSNFGIFFPRDRQNITNSSADNDLIVFPPTSHGFIGGRGRGGGAFIGFIGDGRGGSQNSLRSADNNSRASLIAQNGSFLGSNQGSDINSSEMASTSTTAGSRFGGRGGRSFGRGGRGRSGGNDTCSDLSMESIRD